MTATVKTQDLAPKRKTGARHYAIAPDKFILDIGGGHRPTQNFDSCLFKVSNLVQLSICLKLTDQFQSHLWHLIGLCQSCNCTLHQHIVTS
jgi:hypothetical protein